MKKFNYLKSYLMILSLFLFCRTQGQIIFTSEPDSIAYLNQTYTYQVETVVGGTAPVYSLIAKPEGMSINSATGLVSWLPDDLTKGGKVRIQAINDRGTYYQEYYLYLTDAIVCDNNLVGYWPLDAKNGTSLPDIANGHDAAFFGPTEPEPVISNHAMNGNSVLFTPTNYQDKCYTVADQTPFQFAGDDDFSVSFWFKNQASLVSPTRPEVLVGRYTETGRWFVEWDVVTEMIRFGVRDNGSDEDILVSSTVIDDYEWHHVVATFDGKLTGDCVKKIYIDKTNVTTGYYDYWKDNYTGTGVFSLGFWYTGNDGNTYPFSGYLDEVAYYNRLLTPTDVSNLNKYGTDGDPICQPGNTAPIITSTAKVSATEDVAYSYTFTYREINESDVVVLSSSTLPAWLSFNTETGVLSGTPTNAHVGTYNITLTVTDGTVPVSQTFTITVNNVNDLPVISSSPATSVNEDAEFTYTMVASDIDAGSTLTYSAEILPSWMTFNTSTHKLGGTPTNNQVGLEASKDYDVSLRVTDNTGAYVEQNFTITVNQVNDAPVINSQALLTTNEDVSIALTLTSLNVTDVDNSYPNDHTLTVKSGTNYTFSGLTITPNENFNGTLTVPVELSDGSATVSYNLSIAVTAVNDAPVFTSTAVLTAQTGQVYNYWIYTSDAESQPLTLTCTEKPSWLRFDANAGNGLLTGTPANPGNYNVSFTVSDGTVSTVQSFTVVASGASAINNEMADIVRVFPNPATDHVIFEFADDNEAVFLKIFSIEGKLIKDIRLTNQKSYTLDVTDFSAKEYIYSIKNGSSVINGKLLLK